MSTSATQSQIAQIEAIINTKKIELIEYEKKKTEIEETIAEVESASSEVEKTGYSNTFDYVKQNCGLPTTNGNNGSSKNYWIVQDSNGESYGDVVSFGNALDELTNEVSNVSVSMSNIMSKATEKIEEYTKEIERLKNEIAECNAKLAVLKSAVSTEKSI